MIKFENTVTPSAEQWKAIIMGSRNPLNSWEKSDSDYRPILCSRCDNCMSYQIERWDDCDSCEVSLQTEAHNGFIIGPNDYDLMKRLRNAGTDHRKFMRMITVYVDITAPLYLWKEFDAYKVGTVANSCSTMHKIHAKEFTIDDFSHEHLFNIVNGGPCPEIGGIECTPTGILEHVITALNYYRKYYLSMIEQKVPGANEKAKDIWWQMIQLLPSSYNQKRTVMLNYEVLANMYKSRKNHRLDEWHTLCSWIETLPYHELITGEFEG